MHHRSLKERTIKFSWCFKINTGTFWIWYCKPTTMVATLLLFPLKILKIHLFDNSLVPTSSSFVIKEVSTESWYILEQPKVRYERNVNFKSQQMKLKNWSQLTNHRKFKSRCNFLSYLQAWRVFWEMTFVFVNFLWDSSHYNVQEIM